MLFRKGPRWAMTWIIKVTIVHGWSIQSILPDIVFVWGDNEVFSPFFSLSDSVFFFLSGFGRVVGFVPTYGSLSLFEILFVDTVWDVGGSITEESDGAFYVCGPRRTGCPNVRMMVPVFNRWPSRWTLIFLTSLLPCADILASISSSDVSVRSRQRMTPFFRVHAAMRDYFYRTICQHCGTQQTVWIAIFGYLNNEVSRSTLLTDVGVPAEPLRPFSMAKGLSFANRMSLFVSCITRNLGHSVRDGSSASKEESTSRKPIFVRVGLRGCFLSIFRYICFGTNAPHSPWNSTRGCTEVW